MLPVPRGALEADSHLERDREGVQGGAPPDARRRALPDGEERACSHLGVDRTGPAQLARREDDTRHPRRRRSGRRGAQGVVDQSRLGAEVSCGRMREE